MDELSLFACAPPLLRERERELLRRADLVFTGGQSLYQAKRSQHHNVHAFPSSVDRAHFAQARSMLDEQPDQRCLPRPRLGFYGVIDERIDLDLAAGIARLRPDWQLVLIGPVAKIDAEQLPRLPNIHYLGIKDYADLPAYLANWDVAIMPFAHNDATRFISPTKTLEYLAAGKPVVSTSIADVVTPYGRQGLVQLADTPEGFVAAAERATAEQQDARLPAVDAMLAGTSWQQTWERMRALIEAQVARHKRAPLPLGLSTTKEPTAPRGTAVKRRGKRLGAPVLGFPAPAIAPALIAATGKELE
jgi:glycosyltransferase involved in cell wall biosynthesis